MRDGYASSETILCGIDLGSNSFHMVIARMSPGGRITFIDRRKEYIRLAGGLRPDGSIDPETRQRALDCLSRFGDRLMHIPERNVRVVGTNTFRKARDQDFQREAQEAIGKTIHIISGLEEARLVYRGVGLSMPEPGKRLVVDIGGGSTEFILGDGEKIEEAASHYCGCVSWTLRFFPDGVVTRERFDEAVMAARRETGNDVRRFRDRHEWALGSSGTINAIERIVTTMGWSPEGISLASLERLQDELVAAGSMDALDWNMISADRKRVLPGGVAILKGVFRTLGVQSMRAVPTALREGVLLDLWGRKQDRDIRQSTVEMMQERFEVDRAQAERVRDTALQVFDASCDGIGIPVHPFRNWLSYAAAMHEIGLFLGFSGYHKHGAYLLANGELPGFSWQEQRGLAGLVLGHRGHFDPERLRRYRSSRPLPLELFLIFRVSRRLHRRRSPKALPSITVVGTPGSLALRFPAGWLDERPLTVADLTYEKEWAQRNGLMFQFS